MFLHIMGENKFRAFLGVFLKNFVGMCVFVCVLKGGARAQLSVFLAVTTFEITFLVGWSGVV